MYMAEQSSVIENYNELISDPSATYRIGIAVKAQERLLEASDEIAGFVATKSILERYVYGMGDIDIEKFKLDIINAQPYRKEAEELHSRIMREFPDRLKTKKPFSPFHS